MTNSQMLHMMKRKFGGATHLTGQDVKILKSALGTMTDQTLNVLAQQDIKFVSHLAKQELITRGETA